MLAHYFEPGAMQFYARLKIAPGQRVLGVACGVALAIQAVRDGAHVTEIGMDDSLRADILARATTEGLTVHFDQGAADYLPYAVDNLPYEDGSFDLVASLFGLMFTRHPQRVAAEMMRVCRPGGYIAMGNWTPQSSIGSMLGILSRYAPLPPGVPTPTLWGDEETVRDRFGRGVAELELKRRLFLIHYPYGVAELVEFYRAHYAPVQRAFSALDEHGQAALRHELEQHWTKHNHSTDGTVHIRVQYLEMHARRAAQ